MAGVCPQRAPGKHTLRPLVLYPGLLEQTDRADKYSPYQIPGQQRDRQESFSLYRLMRTLCFSAVIHQGSIHYR